MEEIFFTADHHFFHGMGKGTNAGILKHQRHTRPFATVQEMNEALIQRWNERVKRNDRIYHLGDLSFGTFEETWEVLRRLNGQKHLILGNHDRFVNAKLAKNIDSVKNRAKWSWFVSISQIKEIRVDRQRIVMCHYAFETWNTMHYGTWHLHGHSHGSLPIRNDKLRMDVGVDAVPNLAPISFEEVKAIMSTRKFVPVDHHKKGFRE